MVLGYRIQDTIYRIQQSRGYRTYDHVTIYGMINTGYMIQGDYYIIQGTRRLLQNTGYRILGTRRLL